MQVPEEKTIVANRGTMRTNQGVKGVVNKYKNNKAVQIYCLIVLIPHYTSLEHEEERDSGERKCKIYWKEIRKEWCFVSFVKAFNGFSS